MESIKLKTKYIDTQGIYDSSAGKTQDEVNYNKVDKIIGMGLSSNDYSSSDKEKVSNIQNMAYLNYIVTGEGYTLLENKWISTADYTVDVTTITNKTGYCCIAVPCVGGDKFTITGAGSTSTHRLYVFVKADGTYPSSYAASSNATAKNKVLTAPSDAVYLVMNASMNNTDYPPSLYEGAVNQPTNNSSSVLPTYSNIADRFIDGALRSDASFSFAVQRENISPVELNIESMYEGDSRPYIFARLYNEAGKLMLTGQRCNVGRTNQFIRQTFRIPNNEMVRTIILYIIVPEGSALYINNFNVNYNPCVKPYRYGIEFSAHEGFDLLYPRSSYRSINGAADLGFDSCVVIPKFTSGNVPVCFHNDGSPTSKISSLLKNEDGTAISSLTDNLKISDFTYDQLMRWSIGYTNSKNIYPEQKILLMDDFLRICAKTGMRPIFSIHPNPELEQWGILKNILDKYNLTEQLSIKSGDSSVWKRAITTFGDNKINSIIFLIGTDTIYNDNMSTVISSRRETSGATNTKIVVEFYGYRVLGKGSQKDIDARPRILEMVQEVLNAGCEVSIIVDDETTEEMEYFLDIGATKFMIAKNGFCSSGLNW